MNIYTDVKIERAETEEDFRQSALLLTNNEPWITYGRTFEYSLAKVKDPDGELYVAKTGGAVVGCLLIEMHGQLKGFIRSVCVSDECRGKGIGTKLLNYAEARIFSETPNVFLFVSSFNRLGKQLYLNLGYEEIGLFKDYVLENYGEYLLRKTIGSSNGFTPAK